MRSGRTRSGPGRALRAVISAVVLAPAALVATAGPASALPPPMTEDTVHRVAGDGTLTDPAEGVPAADSPLPYPTALATGPNDTVYVGVGAQVYEIGADGVLRRYAGSSMNGGPFTGNGPALSTEISYVKALAVAPNGDLYIGDNGNNLVYKVDHGTKVLTKVAGNGTYDPDNNGVVVGGPAINSPIDPSSLAADGNGNVYISNAQLAEVLKVDAGGTLTRFAGLGTRNAPAQTVGADPVAATTAVGGIDGMVAAADGSVYLTDVPNGQILKVGTDGRMTVFAGTGTANYGDPVVPGPAVQSPLLYPQKLAMTPEGTFYVATYGSELYQIDTAGDISVLSGNTAPDPVTDGAPLSGVSFSHVYGIAAPLTGDSNRIYVVEPTRSYLWRIELVDDPGTPGAPTGLAATARIGSADISFTAPVDGGSSPISSYQYSIDGGVVWEDIATTGSTTVTGRITGLTPGWQRTVVVRAVNGSGGGPASDSVTVTPLAAPPVPATPPVLVPSEPTGLVAKTGDARVELSFRAPELLGGAPISGYEYNLGGLAWLPLVVDTTGGTPAALITGLSNGTAYTVKIRAVNSAGPSAASAPVTATPHRAPPAPQSLSSSGVSPAIQRVEVPLQARQSVTLLTANGSPAGTVTDPGVGTYRLADRTISFSPLLSYSGTPAGVTFRVSGGDGLSGTAVYIPTVTKPGTPAPPVVTPGPGGGTTGSSGKQAVKGTLQPGQTVGLMTPAQIAAAQAGPTTKIPVAGQGTYQLFRSGRAFTITFTPAPGFVGRTSGITYRISDAFGQYVDATYRPVVTPAALPRIDRSGWAPIPANPKRSTGKERRTKAFNSSYRGYDAHPSTVLGTRLLSRNQATTLAAGTLFQGAGATLSTQGRAAVRKLVANLKAGQRIACEGYTDYAAAATTARSQSQNRAAAVCAALKASGAKVTSTATGYGAQRPAVIGGTAKSRTENQRVVVVVTG